MIKKIVSGGQLGIDLTALCYARAFGVKTGGWAPKGYLTEMGPTTILKTVYKLEEMPTEDYPSRRWKNIETSDITVVISFGNMGYGTKATIKEALYLQEKRKYLSFMLFDFSNKSIENEDILSRISIIANIANNKDIIINFAGSRLSRLNHSNFHTAKKFFNVFFKTMIDKNNIDITDKLTSYVDEDTNEEIGNRVSGNCVCDYCKDVYLNHPMDHTRLTKHYHENLPYLYHLCDGRIVKL